MLSQAGQAMKLLGLWVCAQSTSIAPFLAFCPSKCYVHFHFTIAFRPPSSSSVLTFGPNGRMDSRGKKGEKKQTLVV